ncbi:MAG: cyclic nucleotide-binding domain-containing protein [Thiohalophilus sp.]|uniref:cyclic nucleotide-binding domain-containing protein n=1 Tax=Thiohalophilus sp. TaxID=3028392 RepID=UPI0028709535|nr:cyclic nucleotide-binding domain-containing protein [Thiohalophilus sp.]MDR9436451.1 cyclic nucleotide-binding domain-containing protein [Thiohalophilus sp.]
MEGNGQLRETVEQAIERQDAFGELLTQAEKELLLDFGVVRSAAPGEYLCRPDQVDTRVYILVIGEVEVLDAVEQEGAVLARLGRGELFGEISALFRLPRISAVRVSRPAVLLEIPGDVLERVISGRPELYHAVIKRYKQRITDTALRRVALFRYVPVDRLSALIEHSSLVGIPPGETIVREGEAGDALYIIIYGTARVTHQVGNEAMNLALLRAGDYLGEWSVLTGAPRAATVTAITRVDVIRVDCQPFLQFIQENPEIRDRLDMIAFNRHAETAGQEQLVDSHEAMDEALARIQNLIDQSD